MIDRELIQAVGACASALNRIEFNISNDDGFKKAIIDAITALVAEQAKMNSILAQMIAAECIHLPQIEK